MTEELDIRSSRASSLKIKDSQGIRAKASHRECRDSLLRDRDF